MSERRYRLEEQVGHLLRRAHQRHTAIFLERIGDARMTATQYAALVKLMDAGELSQNHLGRLTAMDPATIQGVIRRLTQRKLIEVRADGADKRRRLLRLSPAGRTLVKKLMANGPGISAATLEPLTPEQTRTFVELLKKIS
jgi:MarR family transcriptional regulator, lower aerobic nicotinate degradation pathway regulator